MAELDTGVVAQQQPQVRKRPVLPAQQQPIQKQPILPQQPQGAPQGGGGAASGGGVDNGIDSLFGTQQTQAAQDTQALPQQQQGAQQGAQQQQLGAMAGDTGGGLDTTTSVGGGTEGVQLPVNQTQALQSVQQRFASKFNRQMTADEQQLAMQVARQNGWDGVGEVPQNALQAVYNAIDTYTGGGTGGGGGTGTGGTGGGGTGTTGGGTPVDPTVAQKQANDAFLKKFGRMPNQQEMQWLYTMAGYQQGGQVNQDMVTKALDAISRYTGRIDDPFGAQSGGSPTEDAARKRLNELLNLDYNKVDENNPALVQQRNAFALQNQRAADRQRAENMERAAKSGAVGAAGVDVLSDAITQKAGETEAGFNAQLIAGELQTQRQNLQQAIQLAMETGQQDKARMLQEKLGMLELDLKKYLGKGQLGLGLMQAMMGNQQFYEGLGLDYAKLQQAANAQAINSMFSGGF